VIDRLRTILARVSELTGSDFSGIGLIVHRPGANLPTFPLRSSPNFAIEGDPEQVLAKVALCSSDLHDGFHLLSSDWKVTAVAQYFSPPIIQGAEIRWCRRFGGRYLAAQFGSALPDVELTGIATKSLGLAIFKAGREVYFEKP
jgi:hypothetical protein